MGKRTAADSDAVLTFKSDRMVPPEPIQFDEDPDIAHERIVTIMETACQKGGSVDVRARAHIVQRPSINDANIETCGLVVTLGNSMFLYSLDAPMRHFTLMGPKDKSGNPIWMKSVHANFDMGAVFKGI